MWPIRSIGQRTFPTVKIARAANGVRSADLHQQQNPLQRRTYAGIHSRHSDIKSSNVPWAAAAAVGTIGGLYFVLGQDLDHGAKHDTSTERNHVQSQDLAEKSKAKAPDDKANNESQNGRNDEILGQKTIPKKENPSQPGAGRPSPGEEAGLVGHGAQEGPKAREYGTPSPDVSDKPDPRGKPKSFNEMSGKQEGFSNADTHHTSQVSKQDDKSKKGEGVAETAKLKGTVSTNRPGPENKEERGKAQLDKDA